MFGEPLIVQRGRVDVMERTTRVKIGLADTLRQAQVNMRAVSIDFCCSHEAKCTYIKEFFYTPLLPHIQSRTYIPTERHSSEFDTQKIISTKDVCLQFLQKSDPFFVIFFLMLTLDKCA